MSDRSETRRRFLKRAAAVAGSALVVGGSTRPSPSADRAKLHLACNHYPWIVFYRRENRNFNASLDSGLAEVAASGMDGFEPIVNGPDDVDRLAPLLEKHGLQMRSLYVNSVLHDSEEAEKSIAHVLAIAEKAKATGTGIIVTNPNPIRWGGDQSKDDAQLRVQARSLDTLGAELRSLGLVLSYHNHDVELQNAAREFHHMMLGTDPENVTLCLDAHWIYRGAGNSSVALFDVVKLYGSRVTELHLRQSAQGVWTEALEEGDIDYTALAKRLLELGVQPHIVIEQAVEEETPRTIDALESHRRSREYVDRVFARFAG